MEDVLMIYNQLRSKYSKERIGKKELAVELSISVSTINYRISNKLDLPNYQKGNGKRGGVFFPLMEVAKYLVKTVKVMSEVC
ncbi:MAG: hypothetical protein ORN24_06460 [Burkholderiales bacterium]|nr:hypothetical protein [Burkholderiales bacterium]